MDARISSRLLVALTIAVLAGATAVGYLSAINPRAVPEGALAVIPRVACILSMSLVGVYLLARSASHRIGALLAFAGLAGVLWMSTGASDGVIFSVGWFSAVLVVPLWLYILLAFPTGRLRTRLERRFVAAAWSAAALFWIPLTLASSQPAVSSPLVRCAPHCPPNVFFVAGLEALRAPLRVGLRISLVVFAFGSVVLLIARLCGATPLLRRTTGPVVAVSIVYAGSLTIYMALQGVHGSAQLVFGWIVNLTTIAVPLTVLLGLGEERIFMGAALRRVVATLPDAGTRPRDAALAAALGDPSARLVYRVAGSERYVDGSGRPIDLPGHDSELATTEIARDGVPLAVIVHHRALGDHRRFVEAAGHATMMAMDRADLQDDLNALIAELETSRRRVVEGADAERRRIERELHDGVQQRIASMRMRLEMISAATAADPSRAADLLAEVGDQMQAALDEVRALAHGVYPALLADHGLPDAIRAAARRAPFAIAVSIAGELGDTRYPEQVERAVYFACVEVIEYLTSHADADAEATLRTWRDEEMLRFEISASAARFDEPDRVGGPALSGARDRVAAVGGTSSVEQAPGRDAMIRGAVPIRAD